MGYNVSLSCTNMDIVESCDISVLDDIAQEDNYIQVSDRVCQCRQCEVSRGRTNGHLMLMLLLPLLQGELKWTRYFEGQSFANNCTSGASYPITCSLRIEDDPLGGSGTEADECLHHGVVDSCPGFQEDEADMHGACTGLLVLVSEKNY